VSKAAKPGRISNALRKFQADRIDDGWRIKLIQPNTKLQISEVAGGIVPCLSIGGLVGFLTGFWLLASGRHKKSNLAGYSLRLVFLV